MNRKQYYKVYYKANYEYIRIYQYLYYRNKKNELERDLKKVSVIPNDFNISLEE